MKKTLLSAILTSSIILPLFAFAADNSNNTVPQTDASNNAGLPSVETVPAYLKMDFMDLKMPGGNPRMGLLGAHYELNLLPVPDLYTGPGLYGAITGDQGGFFILGLDNDYRPRLNQYFLFDTGVFLGGGGARSAQAGGGFVYIPHIGLDFQPFKSGPMLNLSYSHADFTSGGIHSSQVMLAGIMPLDFKNYHSILGQQSYNLSNDATQFFIAPLYQDYITNQPALLENAGTLDKNIGAAGVEVGGYFNDNFYFLGKASGAAHGNANGYMDVLAGPGLSVNFSPSFHWLTDALVGTGGGGNIDTHNGILLEAETGFGWNITPAIEPRLMVGYITAPSGNFNAKIVSAALAYHIFSAQNNDKSPLAIGDSNYELHKFSFSFMNQTLFNPATKNITERNVQMMGFNLKQDINHYAFINYRSAFAYHGDSAGGMAEGAFGAGLQVPAGNFDPYADIMLGAIGGGNINAGGGLFYQPEIGLDYNFNQNFGAKAFYGRIISTSGPLDSNVLGLGVSYNFGKLML